MQSRPIRPWQGRPAAAAGFEPAAALGGKGANAALLQNSQQAFPFALRALQDFRRGNHQHLKPPLLHITEQFLYIRAKQQRRSLRRVADALLLDQPAQLVGRAAAGVALPKHCGGVLGVILVKALYRHCASPPFSGEIICLIKAMRSQPDASVTVLEPTLKIEIPFRSMDIVAKHVPADKDGVRIAELDEQTYRQTLWGHTPLTDFWRVGRGYERRLQKLGLNTMGDIALCSCGGPREYYNEDLLYKTFGVNAELLIDHAWGWEPTTIADIKAYKPESSSLGSGQVLTAAYPYEKARLVVREMAEELILNLVDKGLVTDQIDLTIGYDTASLTTPGIRYTGPVTTDHYGRKVPKHAHGTRHLGRRTQSAKVILDAAMALFDRIVNPALLVRRVNIVALHILVGQEELPVPEVEQLDLFTDCAKLEQERLAEQARLERESRIQQAALSIKRKFGKNALVKGMDLQEDATAMTRNNQIGGHKA